MFDSRVMHPSVTFHRRVRYIHALRGRTGGGPEKSWKEPKWATKQQDGSKWRLLRHPVDGCSYLLLDCFTTFDLDLLLNALYFAVLIKGIVQHVIVNI